MNVRRGTLVVGASVAALTAGYFLYRWYRKHEHEEQLESEELVREFDETMDAMSKPKRAHRREPNGRHHAARA